MPPVVGRYQFPGSGPPEFVVVTVPSVFQTIAPESPFWVLAPVVPVSEIVPLPTTGVPLTDVDS